MAGGTKAFNWTMAIAASVAIHALVIGLLTAGSTAQESPDSEEASVREEKAPVSEDAAPQRSEPSAVPAPSASDPSPAAKPSASAPSVSQEISVPQFHVVKQGDTLTKIAKIYGLDIEDIALANGKSVKKMNVLWVGQKIKLR